MPTYVYRCEGGHQYERRESFSAPTEHDCDSCGRQARRIPVAAPVIFKGSGFYKTDSRSSNGSSDSSSGESSSTKSEGTSSSTGGDSGGEAGSASSDSSGHGHSHGPGPGTHTH